MSSSDVALKPALPHMASVERISKLPVVEQTMDLATNIYGRVKDTNPIVSSVLSTAEYTVKEAVDKTIPPMASMLERPIKAVDSILCSSLDYVENKIPAVKLPAEEMYSNTKDYVLGFPMVKCACQLGQQGALKAVECVCAVSEYGTSKLKELKETLEEKTKVAELSNVLTAYAVTLLNVLATVSQWTGKNLSGVGQKLEVNGKSSPKKEDNNSSDETKTE